VIVVGSLLFGVYLVAANWADYRSILLPGRLRDFQHGSLRRTSDWKEEEDAEE
jgi:hypothetical protein